MTTSAHTPGPWRIEGLPFGGVSFDVIGNTNWTVCERIENHADARLIAAAPEMLEALKEAADWIKDLDGGNPETETGWKSEDLLDVWMKARAAIAKAEGKP